MGYKQQFTQIWVRGARFFFEKNCLYGLDQLTQPWRRPWWTSLARWGPAWVVGLRYFPRHPKFNSYFLLHPTIGPGRPGQKKGVARWHLSPGMAKNLVNHRRCSASLLWRPCLALDDERICQEQLSSGLGGALQWCTSQSRTQPPPYSARARKRM